jgi:hypothetical protein
MKRPQPQKKDDTQQRETRGSAGSAEQWDRNAVSLDFQTGQFRSGANHGKGRCAGISSGVVATTGSVKEPEEALVSLLRIPDGQS